MDKNGNGDRRTLSLRLKKAIAHERSVPGARLMCRVGTPQQEFEYVNGSIPRLRTCLDEVSTDMVSHHRFMSLLLHLEGRLNRIEAYRDNLNLSEVIFSVNEEISSFYNEFLEKLRSFVCTRAKQILNDPAIVTMQRSQSNNAPARNGETQPNNTNDSGSQAARNE